MLARTRLSPAMSVPLAILIGFGAGVLGYFSPRAERFILPTLDLLQTIPAFAYLLPILLLFGFGPVVGLLYWALGRWPRTWWIGAGAVALPIIVFFVVSIVFAFGLKGVFGVTI